MHDVKSAVNLLTSCFVVCKINLLRVQHGRRADRRNHFPRRPNIAIPFIPVDETVLVEMRMSLYAQKIENTLYFTKTGGWEAADFTALHNALLVWWTDTWAVGVASQVSLREIAITDLSSESATSSVVPAPTPNPTGHVTGLSLPGGSALCVAFRTLKRGRSFRGRNYVPGIGENRRSGNQVLSTMVADMQTAYNALIPLAADLGVDWVVVSRFANKLPRVTGIATKVNAAAVVDDNIDSQRRRLTGRGA